MNKAQRAARDKRMLAMFPNHTNAELAKKFGLTARGIEKQAQRAGLKKSPEHLSRIRGVACQAMQVMRAEKAAAKPAKPTKARAVAAAPAKAAQARAAGVIAKTAPANPKAPAWKPPKAPSSAGLVHFKGQPAIVPESVKRTVLPSAPVYSRVQMTPEERANVPRLFSLARVGCDPATGREWV